MQQPEPSSYSTSMSLGFGRDIDDAIKICDLLLTVSLEFGAQWIEPNAAVEQPISVSISIFHDISRAAQSDDLAMSIDYSMIAKDIRTSSRTKTFSGLRNVSHHISNVLASTLTGSLDGLQAHIKVVQLQSPLHTKAVGIEHVAIFRSNRSWIPSQITHFVEDLSCPAILGVNPQERVEKQDVIVNLSIKSEGYGFDGEVIDLRLITRTLYDVIGSSSFHTLEALTSLVASKTLTLLPVYASLPTVLVRIAKPSAVVFANRAEVQMRRSIKDLPMPTEDNEQSQIGDAIIPRARSQFTDMETRVRTVAIGMGSNLGDKVRNIEHALRLLETPLQFLSGSYDQVTSDAFVHIVDTSFLYETQPMYVKDQPPFINGACMIETNLLPDVLLALTKAVELKVGRLPSKRYGPRVIDLDILFYENEIIDTRPNPGEGEFIVPHPRLSEREFILRPLNDMIPDFVHPVFLKSVESLLAEIRGHEGPMKKIIPFPQHGPSSDKPCETQCFWSYENSLNTERPTTQVMATVNATPDSFSDGGLHDKLSAALFYISSAISAGATIIDVGGYSTRPGAAFVSVEEEANRVIPIIRAMRNRKFLEGMNHAIGMDLDAAHIDAILTTPISIDTFRWQVAEAAIEAGANCMNDVHAFGGPDWWQSGEVGASMEEFLTNMKAIVRKYSVPTILMHSRGDPHANRDYTAFNYAADEKGRGTVLEGVRVELGGKVDLITKGKGCVRRWLLIVDPGIGFSKNTEATMDTLRSMKEIVGYNMIGNPPLTRNPLRGFPLLVGPSRKSFLAQLLAAEPAGRQAGPTDRTYATAVLVAYAVQQQSLIVRVHDVQEMMDVVKTAKTLYF